MLNSKYNEIITKDSNWLLFNDEARINASEYNDLKKFLSDKGYEIKVNAVINEESNVQLDVMWSKKKNNSLEKYLDRFCYNIYNALGTELHYNDFVVKKDTTWQDIKDVARVKDICLEGIIEDSIPYVSETELLEFFIENTGTVSLELSNVLKDRFVHLLKINFNPNEVLEYFNRD